MVTPTSLNLRNPMLQLRTDPIDHTDPLNPRVVEMMNRSLSQTSHDVACAVVEILRGEGELHYSGGEFQRNGQPICEEQVMGLITTTVLNRYTMLITRYNQEAVESEGPEVDRLLLRTKGLADITYLLRDYDFKVKLLGELKCLCFTH